MSVTLACDRLGAGPVVVLVHGVGIGPWSYAGMAASLAGDHSVVVPHRRGYGSSAGPAASLEQQVDDLAGLVDGPAAFVGVSGGATLVLALALAHPGLVAAAVVHEPALGPLAPDLDAELQAAGAALLAGGEKEALPFVRGLVGGEAWARLTPERRGDVWARAATVSHEVPQFLSFAPDARQLGAAAGLAVVTTVGGASRPSRHRAAATLAAHLGTTPTMLAGVGHLAQIEGPVALAAALRQAEALHRRAGGDQHVLPAGRGDEL